MTKRIIIFVAVATLLMISVVATISVSTALNPSLDPVAFIAAHKGGEAPNYYEESTLAISTEKESSIGPDGYEYFGEYYGGLFWIDSLLANLVSEEDYHMYTDEIFSRSFDFNQRSFCRYFGITKEKYEDTISIFSKYEYYGEAGQYIVKNYPSGVFGTYDEFLEIFVREECRDSYKTDECIPGATCVHTYTYHTITDELIEYVGDIEYAVFKEKYYGSEDYNILKFIDYFGISKTEMEAILAKSSDELTAYKTEYLYGDETMQRQYFYILSAQ